METPTAIKQASPGQLHHLSHSSMMKVVRINVGGKQYKVSCSLFDLHPNSMLAQRVSEQWMFDPEEEVVFIERDGHQFRFVLDFLRGDGHVILPMTVPKPLFLADLAYYGIENVDASKITCHFGTASPSLADIQKEMDKRMRGVIHDWYSHRTIVLLAKECALQHMGSGGNLQIYIYGRNHTPKPVSPILRSYDTWLGALTIISDRGTKFTPKAQEECNKYLVKAGLEIIGVSMQPPVYTIKVTMKLTDV